MQHPNNLPYIILTKIPCIHQLTSQITQVPATCQHHTDDAKPGSTRISGLVAEIRSAMKNRWLHLNPVMGRRRIEVILVKDSRQ